MHPGCGQGQGHDQRSRDTGTFVLAGKSLLLAGKWILGMSYSVIDGLVVALQQRLPVTW